MNAGDKDNKFRYVERMGTEGMKRHVVIGFDARDHVVIGKVFEDFKEAKEYLNYLNTEKIGQIIGRENRPLEYTDIFEMDYIPLKKQLEDNS